MNQLTRLAVPVPLLLAGTAFAQQAQEKHPQAPAQKQPDQPLAEYPMQERVVALVIQKYETSTCAQLVTEKSEPASGQKAAPIANELFECGMIP